MISGEMREAEACDNGWGKVIAFRPYPTRCSRSGEGRDLLFVPGNVNQSGAIGRLSRAFEKALTVREIYTRERCTQACEEAVLEVTPEPGVETVLLVDDDETIRTVLGGMLRSLGYRVLVAEDGVIGLQVAEENRGDVTLLLTDLLMPRMGGLELAARVWERSPETRVLYMSGCCDLDLDCSKITRDIFLRKPFGLDEVAIKIRQVLAAA